MNHKVIDMRVLDFSEIISDVHNALELTICSAHLGTPRRVHHPSTCHPPSSSGGGTGQWDCGERSRAPRRLNKWEPDKGMLFLENLDKKCCNKTY